MEFPLLLPHNNPKNLQSSCVIYSGKLEYSEWAEMNCKAVVVGVHFIIRTEGGLPGELLRIETATLDIIESRECSSSNKATGCRVAD